MEKEEAPEGASFSFCLTPIREWQGQWRHQIQLPAVDLPGEPELWAALSEW